MNKTITFNWDKTTDGGKQRFVAPKGAAVSGSIYLSAEDAGDKKSVEVTLVVK